MASMGAPASVNELFRWQTTSRCHGRLGEAGILGRQTTNGRPIEFVAALGEKPQKSIMQQACKRHGHSQALGCGQREAYVFVSERCSEGSRLELALSDEGAIGFVRRYVEDAGGEKLDVRAPVDAGLADERDGLAQRLDGGSHQKISAEFDEIRRPRLRTDRKCVLSHRSEQRLTLIERRGVACGDDEDRKSVV